MHVEIHKQQNNIIVYSTGSLSETALASGRLGKAQGFALKLAPLFEHFARAFEIEAALRRPFL